MQASNNPKTELILQLENLKRITSNCKGRSSLSEEIKRSIQIADEYLGSSVEEGSDLKFGLAHKINGLRDLHFMINLMEEEQIPYICKNVVLLLSTIQFEVWQGSNEELISLTESAPLYH